MTDTVTEEILPFALARRYRPQSFQAIVGQEATLRALTNALETQRLHHAYLFTGTRGVGKTTLARILAKCLNCEKGISANACGECGACKAIDAGRFVDLIEVDAASRTKVEDTRELLDNVQYMPNSGRFKIYLIDEVHMLSTHSFNALLKTLEEPPSHVKFLLATTDPQKLPLTVLSRCLQFHLHRLSVKEIVPHLQHVIKQEKGPISAEFDALQILAAAAEGSMRDALSLLEQALCYGNGQVTQDVVRAMLGLSPRGGLIALLRALLARDAKQVMQEINRIYDKLSDFSLVLSEFLSLLHELAIAEKVPELFSETYEGMFDREAIVDLAKLATPEEIQLYYQIGLLGQRDLPYAPNTKMGFEMVLLRMLAFQPVNVVETGTASTSATRPAAEKTIRTTTSVPEKTSATPAPAPVATKATTPVPDAFSSNDIHWPTFIPKLNLNGMARELAQHCSLKSWSDNVVHLVLDTSQKTLLSKRSEERLVEALSQHSRTEVKLKITVGTGDEVTPAQHNQKLQQKAVQNAKETMASDPKLQNLIKMFDAELEQVSVKSEE